MATENEQVTEENPSDPPSDNELFAAEVHEQPSERDIFAGDEDFFKELANWGRVAGSQRHADTSHSFPVPVRRKRFSTVQKVLFVGIVMTAAMLSYTLLKSPTEPAGQNGLISVDKKQLDTWQKLLMQQQTQAVHQATHQRVQEAEMAHLQTEALSLRTAETLYKEGNYDGAFAAYDQLRQSLPTGPQEELVKDFLQLRMALCMKNTSDLDQANQLFRAVVQSRSPLIRTLASYHLSLLAMQREQFLKAQTRAYQAIALISAANSDKDWIAPLRQECHFLIAEAISRNVLMLCDADRDLPPELWSKSSEIDPFLNLTESEVRLLLDSGIKQLSNGLLGPQIHSLVNSETSVSSCWSVICHGTPIDEVLTRFAANAGLDIRWTSGLKSIEIRNRPVSLYMPTTTTEQFVKVAGGCAGLLTQVDANGVVNVFNPSEYVSLSQHISLLAGEAISLWRGFLLTFYEDKCIPNAHFALGLLQGQRNQPTDAIAQYKLVTNRFPRTSLAAFALLRSSRLKTDLSDYLGARSDLEQLIERDPDTEIANRACLYLADVTMEAGLKKEAARLYRKVYNLGFSLESQTIAALGAGRCFYEMKDFQSAANWLTRYINLAKNHPSRDLYSAYFLLGKSNMALGNHLMACDALHCALAGQLSKEEYVETISALVKAHLKLDHFIEALDVLENIQSWQLSEEDSIEMLLLRSEILRTVGLADSAIAALRDRSEYVSDEQSKVRLSFELVKCHIVKGQLKLARKDLAEILPKVDPGPLAHEIASELADVCVKLGHSSQAISVCLQILNSSPTAQIEQKVVNLLARAYSQVKEYDKAALVLCGRWNAAEAPSEQDVFDDTTPAKGTLHQKPKREG
jgi:tetratricopeptide (TPR) repeat protein